MNHSFKFTFTSMPLNAVAIAVCLIGAVTLTACGKGGDKKAATQVVARVDDAEISMHQVNLLMKGAQNVTADNVATVRQQILDKLIDQQIIVEKANKESLDRTPDVIMAIEAAKKDILANAYLQKLVSNSPKASDSEVKQYYTEHAGLFSKRRIYSLEDISTDKSADTLALLNAAVAKQTPMQEIANSLQAKGIKYSGGVYTRPAEQLPLDIVPKLEDVSEGATIILELEDSTHVLHVVKAESVPMDKAAATPFIQTYFLNTRGKQLIEDKMKQFRKEAKIEYMGDFANKNNPAQASNAEPSAKQDSPSAKKSVIDAGVAGLK